MALSQAQLVMLRNDITVTHAAVVYQGQTLLAWWDVGDDTTLAHFYQEVASPDWWVWRTSITKNALVTEVGPDGTTFNWTGAGFITRSQGERDAWRELFSSDGGCNPSLANVRQAFLDIFSGTQAPAPANRTHLSAMARRRANYGEQLYATGTGSTGSPALMSFEGDISPTDVGQCRSA